MPPKKGGSAPPRRKQKKPRSEPTAPDPPMSGVAPPPAERAGSSAVVRRPAVDPLDRVSQDGVRAARLPFATVGVGASAGGLEALEALLAATPEAPGVAIVIVTHQHAAHMSPLPELLGKRCRLPVQAARDSCLIQSDHVYVAPPGKDVMLSGGCLKLVSPVREGGLHLPIDRFFRSLAQDQEDRAICVVLSGTGTDGTLGLRAVKGLGGMAMVQDAHSARHPGMPLSAAATQLADFVLPPREMPARLLAFARSLRTGRKPSGDGDDPLSELLDEVFILVRQHTGHDFKGYKVHAMRRRVERRMRVHEIQLPHEYVEFLKSNPHEIELLFSELLINVTSFFRDGEVFEKLEAILTERLATGGPTLGLRVWVVGCSTGEEAYSVGILLSEIAQRARRHLEAQIFATDLDQNAIDQARVGWYSQGVAADVGAERLHRFFDVQGNGYRIKKEIREHCVFATQNVLGDPPFTKLDLLLCRNVLIYLGDDLQKRLIPLFHYALKPSGLLLLGTSETIGRFESLFKPLDRRSRIFERQMTALSAPRVNWLSRFDSSLPAVGSVRSSGTASAVFSTLDKVLLERFAPPTVIVNQSGDITYIVGRTGQYLEPTAGEPRSNLFAMAREGLEPALSIAVRTASAEGREVVQHGVRVRINGGHTALTLLVHRLDDPESVRGLFRVSFQSTPENRTEESGPQHRQRGCTPDMEAQLDETRGALKNANEELQTSNEELKSMNEELKSMNEELQSTNEELQSSNEELETSKEELQSLNEELQSVNSELQSKMTDLAQANDDMSNLLNSTQIATLFLDRDLRIHRFTDQAREVIHLIASDIGRPIGDLVSHLRYSALKEDARGVLDTLQPHEIEVQTIEGQWRLLRMLPYRTASNVINGVVITLIDIERVKRAELLAASRAFADSIVQTVRQPLAVLDASFTVVSANPAFVRTFGIGGAAREQRSVFELGDGLFARSDIRARFEALRDAGIAVQDYEISCEVAGLGRRQMLLNASGLIGKAEVTNHMLFTLEDVTARPTTPH